MYIRNLKVRKRNHQGLTLVELVLFIVVLSIAVIGVLKVMTLTTARSADPIVQKQALAVAEALLEEVMLMPFTINDPDGMALTPPVIVLETPGPEPAYAAQTQAETRGSNVAPFDNVNDYDNLTIAGGGVGLGNGAGVAVPLGYSANVVVTSENGFGPAGAQVDAAQ